MHVALPHFFIRFCERIQRPLTYVHVPARLSVCRAVSVLKTLKLELRNLLGMMCTIYEFLMTFHRDRSMLKKILGI